MTTIPCRVLENIVDIRLIDSNLIIGDIKDLQNLPYKINVNKGKIMKITEWFSMAVAAGLMPEWKNVHATYEWDYETWVLTSSKKNTKEIWLHDCFEPMPYTNGAEETLQYIQLRSDGKDLYSLEWRKPTESDIGKMCWYYSNRNHKDKTVYCAELFEFQNEFNVMGTKFIYHLAGEYARPEKYCLLADHNQIAPTEQDFKRIYGE